jgi:hypothetical protein
MLFRRLITPWYLCRDIDATWSGEFIIPRSHKRPVPDVLVPDDAEMESALTEKFQRTKLGRNRDGGVDLHDVKLRSDELKKLAWSPLYGKVQGITNHAAQGILKAEWSSHTMTGRMKVLISKCQEIHENGERFVICSESIYLISLAVLVHSLA